MSIKPKADQTRWTLVLTARRSRTEPLVATKMIRFATRALAEAELAKAKDRGAPAYLLPPIEAWGGKDPLESFDRGEGRHPPFLLAPLVRTLVGTGQPAAQIVLLAEEKA